MSDSLGKVLLIHGLNNSPAALASWAETLQGGGYATECAVLHGHGQGESLRAATAERWLEDVREALSCLSAREPAAPLFVVAYSLGALVITALLDRQGTFPVRALYFLAPALRLTSWGRVRRLLLPLEPLGIALPSFAPRHVRAHNWTPLSAYAALLELVDKVAVLKHPQNVGAIPCRIFLSPDDELVSYRGLRRWLEQNPLPAWHFSSLVADGCRPRGCQHLLCGERDFDAAHWPALQADLLSFFTEHQSR